MPVALPFRTLEPTFFAGLLDDPVLVLRVRPTGANLMFDCGQIHQLAKRVLTRLEALFISHAHMDHWMGIDTVIRHLHALPKTLDLFGPPGIADKLGHKLAAYDWNLAEDYLGSIRVHEVHQHQLTRELFSGPDGFRRQTLAPQPLADGVIYSTPHLQVRATSCQHRVASLVYRIDERPAFLIELDKLAQLQVQPGAWLGELQRCHYGKRSWQKPLQVLKITPEGVCEMAVTDLTGLYTQLARPQRPAALGYISDVGFTDENRSRIGALLRGVDLLLSECTFLREAQDKARGSYHLCSTDLNQLLDDLRPAFFLPMHLSKSYSRRSDELYRELQVPPGTRVLQLPLRRTLRPLLPQEIPWESN